MHPNLVPDTASMGAVCPDPVGCRGANGQANAVASACQIDGYNSYPSGGCSFPPDDDAKYSGHPSLPLPVESS